MRRPRAALFLLAMVAVLVVGSIASYEALPGLHVGVNTHLVGTVKELRRQSGWGGYAATRPIGTKDSSNVPNHTASLLTDLINTDYWAADTSTDAHPWVMVTFPRPVDLDYVLVTSGAGPDFGRMGRPKEVRLSYSDGSVQDLVLKDDPRAFGYELHGYSVSSVKLQILSIYPSTQNRWVAISELEFFTLG